MNALEIIDEKGREVFKILVSQGKKMAFLAAPKETADNEGNINAEDVFVFLQQPEDENSGKPADRHTDTYLQTSLSSEMLQRRLLKLFYDSRTFEEEQGVNILYLAAGFLKWFESDNSDIERFSPLILIPVVLERSSAGENFKVKYTGDDITSNLSLEMKLYEEFGIRLPEFPEELENPGEYLDEVASLVSKKSRWEVVQDDIYLGFFSFSKFIMYRDLNPENPKLFKNDTFKQLLGDGFSREPPMFPEEGSIDDLIKPSDTVHVLDADSSQSVAIEEVRKGRNLVIQGPPGTGKSQTITNLIAAAVNDGKKVLFVAEKMAALEVVHKRLENLGLSHMCLELHSRKANKKQVLQDLRTTFELGEPKTDELNVIDERVERIRQELNLISEKKHTKFEQLGISPFRVVGELSLLLSKGVEPEKFEMSDAPRWSKVEYEQRLELLGEIRRRIGQIGIPVNNPWVGTNLEKLLPSEKRNLLSQLTDLSNDFKALSNDSKAMRFSFFQDGRTDLNRLKSLAETLHEGPKVDFEAQRSETWVDSAEEITKVSNAFEQYAELMNGPLSSVNETSFEFDFQRILEAYAMYGASLFRIFSSNYRGSKALLKTIIKGKLPGKLPEKMQLINDLIEAKKLRQEIEAADALMSEALGKSWRGLESNCEDLKEIINWRCRLNSCVETNVPFVNLLNEEEYLGYVNNAQGIQDKVELAKGRINKLTESLAMDTHQAFSVDEDEITLEEWISKLTLWVESLEELENWIQFNTVWQEFNSLVKSEFNDLVFTGEVNPPEILDKFKYSYFEQILEEMLSAIPELIGYDENKLSKLIQDFCEFDQKQIDQSRYKVALSHFKGIPHFGNAGELKTLKREMEKKRRHMPVRKLLKNAGNAIQMIKPVFMMSPISVANFLELGVLNFDLLLIDEASQVEPVDAFGAMSRCKQFVIVGDPRQLPPTSFFKKVTESEDENEDFESATDIESILGLALTKGIPCRMLNWHYRSRHHSLIACSNREFYNNNLNVIPSPFSHKESLGLEFKYIKGEWDYGKSRTNRIEAKAVAEAVMEHAQKYPELSLGVGTFSQSQQEAIRNELELLWRQRPELSEFFTTDSKEEPFFVKNLENIQGDERDVIFISVGYGKDSNGKMKMFFGPLNKEGGERRLNVLITRAKRRCVVFSSIVAEDIDISRTKALGAIAFKKFLHFAKTSRYLEEDITGKDFDSPFEESVALELTKRGHEVVPQVGVSGFFVDLAVKDANKPGRFILGIECDGASYHSSRTARERDRLRQQLLENMGWKFHRIWSTDWFLNREYQLKKLLETIDMAQNDSDSGGSTINIGKKPVSTTQEGAKIKRNDVEDADPNLSCSIKYEEARISYHHSLEFLKLGEYVIGEMIKKVVDIEGPVHVDVIATRIARSAGLARTGVRIRNRVRTSLKMAKRYGFIEDRHPFYHPINEREIKVRDRSAVELNMLKKPEMLPPEEIQVAIKFVIESCTRVTIEDAEKEVLDLMGIKRSTDSLRSVVNTQIKKMIDDGIVVDDEGLLCIA